TRVAAGVVERGVAGDDGLVQRRGRVVEQTAAVAAGRAVPRDLAVVADQRAAVGDAAAAAHRPGRGRIVADHALVQRDQAGSAATHPVAAGDTAATRAGVVVDGALIQGQRRGQTDDAAAAHRVARHRVPTHLALVQGGDTTEAASDSAARLRRT